MAISTPHSRWLSRYAAFTAVATLGLIALGGLVTSHGVGMAVPDWPTTYGYNMFLFPISQWVGGIFYEHTHRLYASVVGLLTVVLGVWLQLRAKERRWKVLGWCAVALVIVQGVLGGLRVSLMADQIGILHGALAQAFLVLLVMIAAGTSARWWRWVAEARPVSSGLPRWTGLVTLMIFGQLLLGAAMRHQHAGLAIPDFPLAYNQLWPPTDPEFLQRVNAARMDTRDFHPITAGHVWLHMAHRGMALALVVGVVVVSLRLRRELGRGSVGATLANGWMALIGVQVLLGAATVWSNKAADIATGHVVVGAACLVTGALLTAHVRAVARRPALSGRATVGSGAPVGGRPQVAEVAP